jgi:hypothetical protein
MKTAAQYCLLSMAVMILFSTLSVAEVHPWPAMMAAWNHGVYTCVLLFVQMKVVPSGVWKLLPRMNQCGDNRLRLGAIKYVRKHTSQLVCACPKDTTWDAVWASNLARVNLFKCFTQVSHEKERGRGAVFVSEPRRWHSIILKGVYSLSGSVTSVSVTWLFLFLELINQ